MYMDKKTQHCTDVSTSNLTYRFNAIPIKIQKPYFVYVDKLKFILRGRRPRIVNTILKKNEVGRLTLLNFKIYFKSYSNQDSVVLVKE